MSLKLNLFNHAEEDGAFLQYKDVLEDGTPVAFDPEECLRRIEKVYYIVYIQYVTYTVYNIYGIYFVLTKFLTLPKSNFSVVHASDARGQDPEQPLSVAKTVERLAVHGRFNRPSRTVHFDPLGPSILTQDRPL